MKKLPFEGILLVSDMDGTLLDSKSRVSMENKKALEYFVEGGGWFTLATGRMERAIYPYLDKLPVNVPAILYNGAVIFDFMNNEILWENYLDDSVQMTVREISQHFPDIGIEIYHDRDVYFVKEHEETEKHRVREGFTPCISELDNVPKPWYKVILVEHPNKISQVETFVRSRPGKFRAVYSEPQFLELLGEDTSKGNALNQLVNILGCSISNVIAMGDNMNDLEMIKTAGTGIVVENAHCDLKKVASFCCCHHDKHAVSSVVKWIEENRVACY